MLFTIKFFSCVEISIFDIELEVHHLQTITTSCSSPSPSSNWDHALLVFKNACSFNKTPEESPVTLIENKNIVRSEIYDEIFGKNWAIKKVKRSRFSNKQKKFMNDRFTEGARTGKN